MAKLPLILLFLATITFLVAQTVVPDRKRVENAYESFKDEFDEEFDQPEARSGDVSVLTYQPLVKLPDWFVNFDASVNEKFLSIGISDPGLDSLSAIEQATIRALALASFSKQSFIQNVSDNYYLDKDGEKTLGKFNSFTFCTTSASLGFEIIEYEYTSNGEMLVLIEVNSNADKPVALNPNIEFFQSETTGKIITRLLFEVEVRNEGKNMHAQWLLNENSKSFEISSQHNGKPLEIMLAKFNYTSGVPGKEESAHFSFDMKYGLWYAFINALAANLEQMEVFKSQVKFLDEEYDRQYQDLTRVVFTEEAAFLITGLHFNHNKLAMELVKDQKIFN
jgi:hypothetical protein